MSTPDYSSDGLTGEAKRAMLAQMVAEGASASRTFPASFSQRRLWFLDQLAPGNPVYNLSAAFRLTEPIHPSILERSLNFIIQRHDSLRTIFSVVDGEPVQVVATALKITLRFVDLSTHETVERETEAQRLTLEEAHRPFDLERGPLLRVTLLTLSETEQIFLLTLHHIVADGWSMGVLFRELTAAYTALAAGAQPQLAELPIQYPDFAVWQRDYLQGAVLQQQLDYWRHQLADLPVLHLPTDHPRPPVQSFRGAFQPVSIDNHLTQRLEHLGRQEDATLFMVLLAAFQTLLHRYTQQSDIVVGSPIANRTRAELDGLIGFFVNTLVLRTQLDGDPTFRTVLRRVREVALGAYAHQDLPFEKLVEELHPQRDLSRNPLFQASLALTSVATPSTRESGLSMSLGGVATSKFDWSLELWHGGDGLLGRWEYNTDLFEHSTMTRGIGHLRTLLEGIVADADCPLSRLPVLTPAERAYVVEQLNDTRAEFPADDTVHQLFETQAELTPDATALIAGGDQQLTYRRLNERANQVAHYLRRRGVGPETLVGVCLERTPELLVALLGILKAGAAYVPLDASYPRDRLAFMLDDASASIVLTQHRLRGQLPTDPAQLVCLDTAHSDLDAESTANPISGVRGDNLAYVIYTSGSTGRPKGAMLTHRGLANYLNWASRAYPLSEGKGSPVISPITFDLTITSMFLPLICGRMVYLLPEHAELSDLAELLHQDGGFSCIKITPAHVKALHNLLPTGAAVGCTRSFIIGGEALWYEDLASWRDSAPLARFINEYGPTEAVVGCCVYEVPGGTAAKRAVPIGRPIANVELYVLDKQLNPMPIGIPGQLHIGGPGLARGYLKRPELTAEMFIPNPFGSEPGGRLYRTGDMARYLPDGNIEYLGRVDSQVKIRGYRVELGEIATVLGGHSDVEAATVLAVDTLPGDGQLVAYVVPQPQRLVTDDDLRRFLSRTLPEYMLPSRFVTVTELPLTSNGKIDRHKLEQANQTLARPRGPLLEPETPLERILVRLYRELLNVDRVGVHDDFFHDLGGHSLLATQLVSRIRATLNVEVPLREVFEASTVADLASLLRADPATRDRIDSTARVLESVLALSDSEVRELLAQRETAD